MATLVGVQGALFSAQAGPFPGERPTPRLDPPRQVWPGTRQVWPGTRQAPQAANLKDKLQAASIGSKPGQAQDKYPLAASNTTAGASFDSVQGALPGLAPRRPRRDKAGPNRLPTAVLPVARLCLDLPVAHLDQLYDYLVPADLTDQAQPGVRVQVKFGGRRVGGLVVERVAESLHQGRLLMLDRVVSGLPVLTPALWRLVESVAQHYAGVRADVLRLAIPPTHVGTEQSLALQRPALARLALPGSRQPAAWELAVWRPYQAGEAFVHHLAAGRTVRAAWTALPWLWQANVGQSPGLEPGLQAGLVAAVNAVVHSGRQCLVVCPNERQVHLLASALERAGVGHTVRLVASAGAAARIAAYNALRCGQAAVGVGTRAAAFQPLTRPGLVVALEDGDSAMAEPRAPYPHVRQVLALRASQEACSLLIASIGRSVETQALVDSGWLVDLQAPRPVVRASTARVVVPDQADLGSEGATGATRLPSAAFRLLRQGLDRGGPVLVQVPRAGYVPVVACAACRELARCQGCQGPLSLDQASPLTRCARCGTTSHFACPHCGSQGLRHVGVGAKRTALELSRAFPGVRVVYSAAEAPGGVQDRVGAGPAIVVATPGAEPVVVSGYTAALLLEGGLLTGRPDLNASLDALRHWLRAASLVRPARLGGQVMLLGWPARGAAGALLRWDPVGLAARELAERQQLGLPPANQVVVVNGEPAALSQVAQLVKGRTGVKLLGSSDRDAVSLALLICPDQVKEVVNELASLAAQRTAKGQGSWRLQVDAPLH